MYVFTALLIGFFTIGLTNMFGIGGAALATPALRIFLEASPAIALGTTLPVTIPAAAAGAVTYYRHGYVEKRTAFYCCLGGLAGSVAGALLTAVVNLHYLMILTGLVVVYVACASEYRGITGSSIETEPAGHFESDGGKPAEAILERTSIPLILGIGLVAGAFSGLLGVGGGVLLIPGFVYILRMPLKRSFATSLVVIAVIAVPGTIIHSLLHHISWTLVLYLVLGSIPGAYLGARLSIWARERTLYVLLGVLLFSFGVIFIINEVLKLAH